MANNQSNHQCPFSIDLYTAAHPHLLACVILCALDQNRTVLFNKLDYMNFTCILEGVVYESDSDGYMLVDEWLESGLKKLSPKFPDRLILANPLASLPILDMAIREGIVMIAPESRAFDVIDYFRPPSQYVIELRDRYKSKAPENDTKELYRGIVPLYDPTRSQTDLDAMMERRSSLYRIKPPEKFVRQFPQTPVFFTKPIVSYGFAHSLGASIRDKADIVTAHPGFYRWLKKELFQPIRPNELVRRNLFADAVAVDIEHTTVKDVFLLIEHHSEWSTFRKLNERVNVRRSSFGEIAIYGMEQIAGLFGAPFAWAVKLGSFIAKKLRKPR